MKTVVVAVSGTRFVVVFRTGEAVSHSDTYQTWKAASRAILGWVEA